MVIACEKENQHCIHRRQSPVSQLCFFRRSRFWSGSPRSRWSGVTARVPRPAHQRAGSSSARGRHHAAQRRQADLVANPTRKLIGSTTTDAELKAACAVDGHGPGASGTWAKCSSGSRTCSIIFGAPWIRMVLCSTSWFRNAEMAKLRSYGVAKHHLLRNVEHRQSRYLNNRAENSHRPTRRGERQMQRFKSPEQAQNFLSAHAFIHGHFRPRRHLLTADAYRAIRSEAFHVWYQETCTQHLT
jgi:DDE domain